MAIGIFSTITNSCVVQGSPLQLTRPASGAANLDICLFSPGGLSTAWSFTFTGPAPNDIAIINKQSLGTNFIRLTLQLSDTTKTGARTLFVENPNKDKTAASGAVEVKSP
jgi:hypothetical protein